MSISILSKKWTITLLSAIIALMVCSVPLYAQTRTVTGVVKSDDDAVLPGVSIIEKGTTNGTVTDAEGRFSLAVSGEAIIVVSFIGMKPQEVPVGNQTSLDISLQPDLTTLDEVVVVDFGYGTVKKSDLT